MESMISMGNVSSLVKSDIDSSCACVANMMPNFCVSGHLKRSPNMPLLSN